MSRQNNLVSMLETWYEEQAHQEIYDYVSSKPEYERSSLDYYYFMYALNRLHKFHETVEIGEHVIQMIEGTDGVDQLKYYYELLMALYRSGQYTKALSYLEQLKQIHDTIEFSELNSDEKTTYISYFNHAGIINRSLQNYEIALQNYNRVIELGEEYDNLTAITVGSINKGEIHQHFGQYNQAIESFKMALEYTKTTGRIGHKLTSLNNLASAYHNLGKIDEAKEYADEGIEQMRQRDDKTRLSKVLRNRASIYHRRGKFDLAKQDLLESYELKVDIGNDYETAVALYRLVELYLDMDDREKAMETLRTYKELYDGLEVKDGYYDLAEALYLKGSAFYKHKIKAEQLFRKIIAHTEIGTEIRLIASLQLLELLIQQVGDQDDLDTLLEDERQAIREEIMEIYHDVLESQEVMESPLLLIQIYYIRAHLHLFFLQPELVERELRKADEINEKLGVANLNFKEPQVNQQFRNSFPTTLQQSLNKVIHSEPRLKIILALINNTKLVFTELQELVGLTPGNLGKHCDKLVDAGYVNKQKEIVDDKFLTVYSLTPEGISEFQKYRNFLTPFLGV